MASGSKIAPAHARVVYAVFYMGTIDSIHASEDGAHEYANSIQAPPMDEDSYRDHALPSVEAYELRGGWVVDEATAAKLAPKPRAPKKANGHDEVDEDADGTMAKAPKMKVGSGTKPRAAPKGPIVNDADLPANVQALLAATGTQLVGLRIVVLGAPTILGRANIEKLIDNYGGRQTNHLSKKTDYVVIGAKASAQKLQTVTELGIGALDEEGLVDLLEKKWGGGEKRAREDGDEPEAKKVKA